MSSFYMYVGAILSVIAITLMFILEYSVIGVLVMFVGIYFFSKGRNK